MMHSLFVLATLVSQVPQNHAVPPAKGMIDTAIARMGGESTLRSIVRARFDGITDWQRLDFSGAEFGDLPSYQGNSDLRDYTRSAWRMTNRGLSSWPPSESVDLVSDTVGSRFFNNEWRPLSIAYVDERKELFAFAPDRALLAARDAADLKALPDTMIDGHPNARASATIAGYPSTIFIRRYDGYLNMIRYRAAQYADFGLAPWGKMEVEMWYARWARANVAGTPGVLYPMQWDIKRVGHKYKRITVTKATFNPPETPDSFAISDSMRHRFFTEASLPMWKIPRDSFAKVIDNRFVTFGRAGQAPKGVKVGSAWLILDGSGTPERAAEDAAWLAEKVPGAKVGALVVALSNFGPGAVAWALDQHIPVLVAPAARTAVAASLRNWGHSPLGTTTVAAGQWTKVGGDSVWAEPIDLPSSPGTMLLWVPSQHWLYALTAAPGPFGPMSRLMALAAERKWKVESIGSFNAVSTPVPATP